MTVSIGRNGNRADVQNLNSTLSAALGQFLVSPHGERQFVQALKRIRQSSEAPTNGQSPVPKDGPPRIADASRAPTRKPATTLLSSHERSAPMPSPAMLDELLIGARGGAASLPLMTPFSYCEMQIQATLQSSRAQALRAEIERCITIAARMIDGNQCSNEFRWVLSPTLFPDTTITLRRQNDGWKLDIIVGDEVCRNVLNEGIGALEQQFLRRNLGDILVRVSVAASANEPSAFHEEPTSRYKN